MTEALFSSDDFKELADARGRLPKQKSLDLIEYFTQLSEHVDNELFRQLQEYGIHNFEWCLPLETGQLLPASVTARSSYDPELRGKVETQRDNAQGLPHPYGDLVRHAFGRAEDMVREIHRLAGEYPRDKGSEYLQAVKPRVEVLVDDLLSAGETVGSGGYQPTAA